MPKNTIFNLQSIDRSARKRGDEVWVYKGHKCSCSGSVAEAELDELRETGTTQRDGHRGDPACLICYGYGYWYDPKIRAIALVFDVKAGMNKDILAAGIAAAGDLTLVPPHMGWEKRGLVLNDYDKILFPTRGGQPCDGDVLTRGQFEQAPLLNITSFPIARLESVTWHDVNETVPVPHVCLPDIDFTYIVGERRINWIEDGPNTPGLGVGFSVRYFAWYEWVAVVSPLIRYEAGNQLGARILLKKWHTFM